MKEIMKLICACLPLLLLLVPRSVLCEEDAAADLTQQCTIEGSGLRNMTASLADRKLKSYLTLNSGETVSVTWEEDALAANLCTQWYALPEQVTVQLFDADGMQIYEAPLASEPEVVIPLPETARRAVLTAGEDGTKLSELHVYGKGTLPEPFHAWKETPKKLDYLLIATHPDDDVLYLGSVIPIYGAERGYVGTTVFVTSGTRTRVTEAENGSWEMGLRYRPLFLHLPDVPRNASAAKKATFPYETVLREIVRIYRIYHPLVVFAQDEDGEYGHWQHKATSKAAVEAFTLAADPAYDPESSEQYGTWQVQKVYLHLYYKNILTLDASAPLSAFDGDDAWQVARRAFQKHETQQGTGFSVVRDRGKYPFNQFGMAAGVVEAGEDAFDHIDETLLSSYVSPTPTPTPTDTPNPTATPTPTERWTTAVPTDLPTPKSTETPVASAADTKERERLIVAATILGALSAGCISSGLFLMRRERSS